MPVSFGAVVRIWRGWGLQPHRSETFKFSTGPATGGQIRSVVGLYLDPPANAVVVCVDEKSQIQALDRFVAMQKFAACYGANNTTSRCIDSSQAQIALGSVKPSLNTGNWIARCWLMKSNGTTEYHDGFNSRLADS